MRLPKYYSKRYVHLRVENAGRSFDDAGQTIVRLDLEDLVLLISKDSQNVDNDILRLHVLNEGVGQGTGLARLDVDVVAHS